MTKSFWKDLHYKTLGNKRLMAIYSLFVIVIIVFVIISYVTPYPNLGFASDECTEWTSGWQVVNEDGSLEDIELPYKAENSKNRIVEFRATVPNLDFTDRYIFVKSAHQNITIYLNGKEYYNYTYETSQKLNAGFAPNIWLRISLPNEYSGARIRVLVETLQDDGSPTMGTIYIGESVSVFYKIIKLNALPLVLASIIILLGILLLVYWAIYLFKDIVTDGILYIALSAIFSGIWLISQSSARQLLFQNILLVRNMEFFSIMMIPVPAILSLDITEERKNHKSAEEACILIFIVDAICLLLVFLRIADFLEILWIIYCTIGIAGTWAIVSFYRLYRDYRDIFLAKSQNLVAYAVLLISGLLEMSMLSTNFQGYFLPFGMLIFFLGMLREQVMAQNKVFDARMRAEAQNSAKSEFLASMSHEIRSPLNAIMGMDEMILRESSEKNIIGYATDIETAGQSLLKIINQILDFSKIEAGRVKIASEEYNLGKVLQEVISLTRVQAENKGLKLKVEIDEETPSMLIGDSGRIRQMLVNILNNAVKYTEHGSVTLNVYAQRAMDSDTKDIHFRVTDTGKGISAENIEKIFDRFQRITGNDSGKVEGTGLGLAITKQMVELMNGHIDVQSIVGKGSSFEMVIPQRLADFEVIGNFEKKYAEISKNEEYHESFTAPDAVILAVDDNEINLRLVESFLKKTKVQLDTVLSGQECIDKVREKKYDLILLDDLMPGMDGRETLDYLRMMEKEHIESTSVICFTANAIAGSREEYMNLGFDDYIAKPVSGDMLEKTVARWLPEEKVTKVIVENNSINTGQNILVSSEERLVDYSIGLDYCMNDEATYGEVLKLFVDSAKERREKIMEDYVNKNMKGYVVRTHGLKSTALTIGAISLSDLCKELEYAGKRYQSGEEPQDNLKFIQDNNDRMLDLFDKTVVECQEFIKKRNL